MNVIFVKNYGLFWLRISIRILSLLSAFIVGKIFDITFAIYAYFFASIIFDLIAFKGFKLKESRFKKAGYFEKKFYSSPEHYDRYTHSVINAKVITFVLAHLIIFIPFKTDFEGWVTLVSLVYGICLTAIVFHYGFKYGYHKLKAVSEEEAKSYIPPTPIYNGPRGNGYLDGVYTGDPHHIT